MTDEERDALLLELKTGLEELRTSVDAGFAAAKRERDGLSNQLQAIAAVLREGGFPVPEPDEAPIEATG